MIPLFRKQAFGERLLAGVKEVRRVMSNRPKNNAFSTMKEKNTDEGIKGILVILAIVVSAILFFAISHDEFKFTRSIRHRRNAWRRRKIPVPSTIRTERACSSPIPGPDGWATSCS